MLGKLARGKCSLVMLFSLSYLRSITVTLDLMWYICCVCVRQTNYQRQALMTALVMLWEIARGMRWLIMLSWILHLRSIIVTRG
jgi:hypothetical protein